ncbi:YihY/virulence factor BrkB family protein [Pseudorhodoferax soli]|uniref:Membrane protein n=1 Tax=Pseudorhodoferax soli TaxID=545864 RepID=A0A368XWX9_9BURK|nr:YihY/virulence factor BrkB family protein [Pseudorhodoferax soli]RCW72472.1 membrane protein [Pseudorhodoferax soli]
MAQWMKLAKEAVVAWSDDYAPSMGAAISYYTLFSLAPLLVLVIAVAGLAFGAEAVRGQISAQLSALMGPETAEAIEGMVASATVSGSGIWATIASVAVLLVGATTVFSELQSALDRIWHVPEARKPSGIWGLLRARLFSLGLILGLAFLLMVSLAVSAGLAAFGSYVGSLMPGQELLLQVLNTGVALAVTAVLFAMIFKLMPTAKVAWRDVWVGAAVTALLFEVGKLLIGLYLGKSALANSFAGAGALVVLLAWVYYAAQIFLLGAEFTKVYAHAHGSARGQTAATPVQLTAADARKPAEPGAQAPAPQAAVSHWTAHASRELLPKLALLGGLVLLRIVVESRAKRERRLVRKAKS